GRWFRAERLHVRHPGLKFLPRLCLYPVGHTSVLDSAEFTTLRRVLPRDLCLEPKAGFSIGKDIAFGRKLRDPEAMDDVSASHPERHGPTDRHVQLVGRGQ